MPEYVDGFVLPVPKNKIEAYRKLAKTARKVWLDHGALDYRECVAEDLNVQMGRSFPAIVKPKPNETIVFAWIVYKSKAARNRILKKVMADPRLTCDPENMPFDMKRMSYGVFETLVK